MPREVPIKPESVPELMMAQFILDVRALTIAYGGMKPFAKRISTDHYTIQRWFWGKKPPTLEHYMRVQVCLAEILMPERRAQLYASGRPRLKSKNTPLGKPMELKDNGEPE